MELYLLHPIAVHFPIALLATGAVFEACALRDRKTASVPKRDWAAPAASWLLWLGTAGALVALGLGFLAENAAPHVPAAWEVLEEHEDLALWTAGIFVLLSLWRGFFAEKFRRWFFAGWCVGLALLLATGYHGGELVFRFGMGVRPPE